jgi:hypothetical protein
MNKFSTIFIYALLLILLPSFVFSQSLSKASLRIKAAWQELNKHPYSKQTQLAYLKVFPQNKQQFVELFDKEDFSQLYSGSYKYITTFIELSKHYPDQVMDKAINIGKELVWDADATGQLQQAIVNLGCENTRIFLNKIKALPTSQTNQLIKFLADVESHDLKILKSWKFRFRQ